MNESYFYFVILFFVHMVVSKKGDFYVLYVYVYLQFIHCLRLFAVLSDGEFSGAGNNTTINTEKISKCGANFCVVGNGGHENLDRPPDSEIYVISAIYLTCVIVAVLIVALFVDPLSR